MAKIGIISDTHDILRPQVKEILRTCDAIVHGGDFTKESILEELRPMASIYAVQGNNDWYMETKLRKVLRFEIEGVRFVLVHEKWNVPTDLTGVDVVIFGHTHKYFEETIDGRLWLNPGGCGRMRFGLGLTMAVLYAEKGRYYVQKVELNG
ncbi:MAG: metallophosphoesterase family protein [Blautia sp.]|jgi:putative phosphoesterase